MEKLITAYFMGAALITSGIFFSKSLNFPSHHLFPVFLGIVFFPRNYVLFNESKEILDSVVNFRLFISCAVVHADTIIWRSMSFSK